MKNGSPEVAVNVISSSYPKTINNTLNPSAALSNEKLIITSVQENLTASTFKVSVTNNASVQITINDVLINNYPAKLENKTTVLPESSSVELLFTFSEAMSFGRTYEIRILSREGYSATYYKTIC